MAWTQDRADDNSISDFETQAVTESQSPTTISTADVVRLVVEKIKGSTRNKFSASALHTFVENNIAALAKGAHGAEPMSPGRMFDRIDILADNLDDHLYQARRAARSNYREEVLARVMSGEWEVEFEADGLSDVFPTDEEAYSVLPPHRGKYAFQKHYYHTVARMGNNSDDGQEDDAAKGIDGSEHVQHWVRNAKEIVDGGFSMMGYYHHHYPDFVIALHCGAMLALEFKSETQKKHPDKVFDQKVGEMLEKVFPGKFYYRMVGCPSDGGVQGVIQKVQEEIAKVAEIAKRDRAGRE